jgi:nicotinamidase-related amidase/type 1 glutamine amidotransferase
MRPQEDDRGRGLAAALLLISLGLAAPQAVGDELGGGDRLAWTLRSRIEAPGTGGQYRVIERKAAWDPRRTAIIVCDMWDLHHCLNATRRGAELAPRMDRVLRAARDRGVTIIHAPSGCMAPYKDHPARRRAQETTRSQGLPADIGTWCDRIPAEERGQYPIDQSDGGEDDDPAEHARWAARLAALGRNPRAPWRSQTDALAIVPDADYISDDGAEIWSVLEDRAIDHVILLGVHTNMCVLGRPFGLRQMARNGKDVVLMRDMTDTMYNPARAPYVSHFSGTDLIVEHIEKYVCPTITSDQLLGGPPFRFRDDRRPHVVFLIAEDEYRTERTLPEFAVRELARDFRISLVFGDETEGLPGIDILDEADLAVVSVRRRALPAEQMAAIRRFVAQGKPLIGIRTASHAFAPRGDRPIPDGFGSWPEFDAEVLGGHYHGHHGEGPKVAIEGPGVVGHPILAGVDVARLVGHGSLYRVSPLASSATCLLTGAIPGQDPEPVAWMSLGPSGGRVVYTSLGHPDDFQEPAFRRLLRNAADWAVGRAAPTTGTADTTQGPPLGGRR